VSINDFNLNDFSHAFREAGRSSTPLSVAWHSLLCRLGRHEDQVFCVGRLDRTRLMHKECHWCGRPKPVSVKEVEEFDAQFPPVC
jgi:hypothetical protein